MYCAGCRDGQRRQKRRASQQRYWLSWGGRRQTSIRMQRWREQQREKETDNGRREVGPATMVSGAERSAATEVAEPHREEIHHGIDLDGHRPGNRLVSCILT